MFIKDLGTTCFYDKASKSYRVVDCKECRVVLKKKGSLFFIETTYPVDDEYEKRAKIAEIEKMEKEKNFRMNNLYNSFKEICPNSGYSVFIVLYNNEFFALRNWADWLISNPILATNPEKWNNRFKKVM